MSAYDKIHVHVHVRMFVRMCYGRIINELQRPVSEMSTAMSIYTSDTDPPGALSECGRSTVIVDCLSDLAGEVATTQYVQNAEVDQREETILSIQTDLYRGAVTRIDF